MSFLDKVTAFLPIRKKEEKPEYFFAVNIGAEKLITALWSIEGKELKVLEIASESYSSQDEIVTVLDKLLDEVIGPREIEPQKILFGVPNAWILDDNLKDEYLKILRNIVKELELAPMAYVSESNALVHFIEKQEGVPATAILVGFEQHHLSVTVVRAGKLDGVKSVKRGESAGSDIEKALLQFTDVETLPSRILIYETKADELKAQLLSFSWMSKLSFLHFPKIDILGEDTPIKSICLAGASEINSSVSYSDQPVEREKEKVNILDEEIHEEIKKDESDIPDSSEKDSGFVVGDISEEKELVVPPQQEAPLEIEEENTKTEFNIKNFISRKLSGKALPIGIVVFLLLLFLPYIFMSKANIKIFVEPKVLEKDTAVIADPNQKTVNENDKIIPAQIIETEVSGSAKDSSSGKRQIGDPAKGTIVIYNKTSESKPLSKGTQVISSGGLKFTLDTSVTIASQSASDSGIAFGKVSTTVTASAIGADGNLPSGSTFTVGGFAADKLSAKSEGNLSGGTSKEVTVVSSDDVARLLAKLSSDLKQQAQAKLQEKYPGKKILKEALSENIKKKSSNKNINDAASEFSLDMTVNYKGTAFDDADLKIIVSRLVTTDVPSDFQLDLSETETQAEVSKLEKDGKLVFLARFKAKLIPKIDTSQIKDKIRFKTKSEAQDILKSMENILGSDINLKPNLPGLLARIPLLPGNITLEVGPK